MKDFKTKSAVVLIPEMQIDGKDIYLNLASGNLMKTVGWAKSVDLDDPEQMDQMAKLLFTEDSYSLVSRLKVEDFMVVLDLAYDVLDKQEKSVDERFKREE